MLTEGIRSPRSLRGLAEVVARPAKADEGCCVGLVGVLLGYWSSVGLLALREAHLVCRVLEDGHGGGGRLARLPAEVDLVGRREEVMCTMEGKGGCGYGCLAIGLRSMAAREGKMKGLCNGWGEAWQGYARAWGFGMQMLMEKARLGCCGVWR